MPSKIETALVALQDALSGHAATVLRSADLPVECPEAGLLNIVPGDPREVGRQLGTGRREFECVIEIEAVVQGATDTLRDAGLDASLASAAGLLLADRSLGGAVDYLDIDAPQETDEVPMAGAETLMGAVLPVTLFYVTTANPME